MNQRTIQVLDHGSVTLRNVSGPTRRIYDEPEDLVTPGEIHYTQRPFDADDTDPANSARMSFDQTDSGVIVLADGGTRPRVRDDDLKLAEYLLKNWHTTPFEMIEVWIEMKLPIFVARQFVRHRTVTINEVSGRYVTLPAQWFVPEKVGGKPVNKKQGQSDDLDEETQQWFRQSLDRDCAASYENYVTAIERGVAAEHARLFLHVNHYTHWLWKQDLHNLMHFMRLRLHSHAQIEAQQYAQAVYELLKQVLPKSMELFDKYRLQAT